MLPCDIPKTTKSIHCSLEYLPARIVATVPITMAATIRMRNPHKKPLTTRSNDRSARLVRMSCLLNVAGCGQEYTPAHIVQCNGTTDRPSWDSDWSDRLDSRKRDQRSQPGRPRSQERHNHPKVSRKGYL